MSVSSQTELHGAGRVAGAGAFVCVECGVAVSFEAPGLLPECPECGGREYRRASLFEQPTDEKAALVFSPVEPDWLERARAEAPPGAICLALEDDGELRIEVLPGGWTRIGRSAAADIRLDDPTVSRRHAQVVRTEEGEVRVIDDRSLNGVYVNGELVEWSSLADNDELAIGRYRLRLVDARDAD